MAGASTKMSSPRTPNIIITGQLQTWVAPRATIICQVWVTRVSITHLWCSNPWITLITKISIEWKPTKKVISRIKINNKTITTWAIFYVTKTMRKQGVGHPRYLTRSSLTTGTSGWRLSRPILVRLRAPWAKTSQSTRFKERIALVTFKWPEGTKNSDYSETSYSADILACLFLLSHRSNFKVILKKYSLTRENTFCTNFWKEYASKNI